MGKLEVFEIYRITVFAIKGIFMKDERGKEGLLIKRCKSKNQKKKSTKVLHVGTSFWHPIRGNSGHPI